MAIEPPGNGRTHRSSLDSARIGDELREVENDLRAELRTLAGIESALQAEIAGAAATHLRNGGPAPEAEPGDQNAEVILLHTTLASFRRRAAKLRDETEGLRRRVEQMSTSEISGFLEELGEDLAEFEEK